MPKVAQFKERVRTAFHLRGELSAKQISDLVGGGYPPDVVWALRKCGLEMKMVKRGNDGAVYQLIEPERAAEAQNAHEPTS